LIRAVMLLNVAAMNVIIFLSVLNREKLGKIDVNKRDNKKVARSAQSSRDSLRTIRIGVQGEGYRQSFPPAVFAHFFSEKSVSLRGLSGTRK